MGRVGGDDQTPVIPITRLLQEKQCPSMQSFSTVLEINSVVHASADVNRKLPLVCLITENTVNKAGKCGCSSRNPPSNMY